jgi:hypothetical protein
MPLDYCRVDSRSSTPSGSNSGFLYNEKCGSPKIQTQTHQNLWAKTLDTQWLATRVALFDDYYWSIRTSGCEMYRYAVKCTALCLCTGSRIL